MIARRAKKEGIPVEFAKVDIHYSVKRQINLPANRDIAQIYRTHSYPSLHLFKNGDNFHYNDNLNEEQD